MRLRLIVASSAAVLVLGSLSAAGEPPRGDEVSGARSMVVTTPWPGGSSARTVDVRAAFGPDMSGLSYVAGDVRADDRLWAVRDDGRLFRLAESGGKWRPDAAEGWAQGRKLAFPDGRRPDAEAVVMQGRSAYVGTERDGTGVSRPSVVRYDVTETGSTLTATHEWNLREYYPDINPNLGIEALSLVPNAALVAGGFVADDGRRFDPADHPGQYGAGVFMVVVEAPGLRDHVDAYVLSEDGTATRVARLPHPLTLLTEIEFEPDTGRLWGHCDDFCDGQSVVFEVGADGRWAVVARHARIAGLPGIASIKIPGVPTGPAEARAHVERIRAVLPEHVTIGVSGDAFAAEGLIAGCEAWYSVVGGTLPEVALRVTRAVRDGDPEAARAESERLAPLWELFAEPGGSQRVIAAVAEHLGFARRSSLPRPILGLDDAQRARVARVVDDLHLAEGL